MSQRMRVCYEDPNTHEEVEHYDLASNIDYDNTDSGLESENVQDAIDELATREVVPASQNPIGRGTFAQATEYIRTTGGQTNFQWILVDSIENVSVRKIIWYDASAEEFIDAYGSVMTNE